MGMVLSSQQMGAGMFSPNHQMSNHQSAFMINNMNQPSCYMKSNNGFVPVMYPNNMQNRYYTVLMPQANLSNTTGLQDITRQNLNNDLQFPKLMTNQNTSMQMQLPQMYSPPQMQTGFMPQTQMNGMSVLPTIVYVYSQPQVLQIYIPQLSQLNQMNQVSQLGQMSGNGLMLNNNFTVQQGNTISSFLNKDNNLNMDENALKKTLGNHTSPTNGHTINQP